jgi:hypothetical protein
VSSLIIFAVTNGFIKLSVLFFYRRIFVVDKAFSSARNLLFCTMIILIAIWSVVYIFTFIFMCGTRFDVLVGESEDDPSIYCVDMLKVGYSYAISDFISDAIIVLIPIPFVSVRKSEALSQELTGRHSDSQAPSTSSSQGWCDWSFHAWYPRFRCLTRASRLDGMEQEGGLSRVLRQRA